MRAEEMMERMALASPRGKARFAGVLNSLVIVSGIFASFVFDGRASFVAQLIAAGCNIAATLLLYEILKPVNKVISLLAAFLGLALSIAGVLEWHSQGVDIGLIFLGCYCLLIGYLVYRSTFLPPVLGALMGLAGLAWLTLLLPFANARSPYNLAAGILGQGR
jgi:hypothetical protein